MNFRQILRILCKKNEGKIKLRELLFKNRRRLTEQDYLIIENIYLNQLSNNEVAKIVNLSPSYFYTILNMSLIKFETLIDDKEMREIIEKL